MDKKIKIISFKSDLKNIAKSFCLFMGLFSIIMFYQWVVLEEKNRNFTALKLPMFTLFALGFLFFIIPMYMELIEINSNELLLSLPIGGIYYLYFRVIRMYLFYCLVVLGMFLLIFKTTNKTDFTGSFTDVIFILGVSLFMATLGLFAMLIGKNLVWSGIPIFLFLYSYFYQGFGLLYWHVCQWIVPSVENIGAQKIEVTIWLTGLLLLLASGFVLKKKEYLIQ